MIGLIKRIFGTKNEREVNRILETLVPAVNSHEQTLRGLTDDSLRRKAQEWKKELSAIDDDKALAARLEELMPEAFAVVKDACRRLCGSNIHVRGHDLEWDMIPFDVQLVGGYALHTRRIAEMATGEGKTLVATLPVFLNALSGRGVHVVTVNDYLAARDSEWMGAVYEFLGLTVGVIQHDQSPPVRREMYACDVTYGTNSEFGFDYLRDNGMAQTAEEQVQRGYYFAIVDEVDSILIDEARTPLIISGPTMQKQDQRLYSELKPKIQAIVRKQRELCEGYLRDAEKLCAKVKENGDDADLDYEIGILMYRAQLGQPKHPSLLKLKTNPDNLRRLTDSEMELHKDQTKKELYAQKEHLYFAMDEKRHDADLSEKGREFLNPSDTEAFMMPDVVTAHHEIDANKDLTPQQRLAEKQSVQAESEERGERIHVTSQLLKAYCLYERDQQYIVAENKVVIVDEHTGRAMEGRRWSDGLHQAVEAKEGVRIEAETQTYATITIQNYFRLYLKLAGMTGTAETEANEFLDIYSMGVLVIPTNQVCVREDRNDSIYLSTKEKYQAVLDEVKQIHGEGRPILVGTVAVETSEHMASLLKKERIPHSVLNAKYHEQEAEIVARAGQRGTVTIATNMAGRGTDIKLADGIPGIGGLHVLGTERHESRRIDRQLRGRCARQGDPGSSHFFLSLEDDLMRLYGASDKMGGWLEKLGMEEGEEISHPMLNRSIETAQKRVEQHHYQTRRRTLEYDDVMNKQREELYGFRNRVLHGDDTRDIIFDIIEEVTIDRVGGHLAMLDDTEDSDGGFRPLDEWVNLTYPVGLDQAELEKAHAEGTEEPSSGSIYDVLTAGQFAVCRRIIDAVHSVYEIKIAAEEADTLAQGERYTVLTAVDRLWRDHLYAMDGLRQSVHLRAYGQKDPLVEYKTEARDMFEELMAHIKEEVCKNVFLTASSLESVQHFLRSLPTQASHQMASAFGLDASMINASSDMVSEVNSEVSAEQKARPVRTGPRVGRNDPCPCGSGKKHKKCCG